MYLCRWKTIPASPRYYWSNIRGWISKSTLYLYTTENQVAQDTHNNCISAKWNYITHVRQQNGTVKKTTRPSIIPSLIEFLWALRKKLYISSAKLIIHISTLFNGITCQRPLTSLRVQRVAQPSLYSSWLWPCSSSRSSSRHAVALKNRKSGILLI